MVTCLRTQPCLRPWLDLPGMSLGHRGTISRARTHSWPYLLVSLSRSDLSALSLGTSPMHPVDSRRLVRRLVLVDTQLHRQVGVVECWLRSLVPFHPLECGMSPIHPAESLSLVYTHLRRWDGVVECWLLPLASETSPTHRMAPRRLSLVQTQLRRWVRVVECWPRRLVFKTLLTHLADPRHPSLVEIQPRRWQHSVDSWLHPQAFSLSLPDSRIIHACLTPSEAILLGDCEHRTSGLRPRLLSRTRSWSNGVSVLPHTGRLPQPTAVALRRTRVIPHPLMAARGEAVRGEVISQCPAWSLLHSTCRHRAPQPASRRRPALPELEAPAARPARREWWRSLGTFWEFRRPGTLASTRLGGSRASRSGST